MQTDPDSGGIVTNTFDTANRLLTSTDVSGSTTYTYDANGNQLTIEEPGGDITTNTWDGENRLVVVEHPSGDIVTYAYNGDGLRVSLDDGVEVVRYVYDGNNLLQETDDTGVVTAEYTYQPSEYGLTISQHRDGDSSFHHFDGIHNTAALTDGTGTVTDEYQFDAFGENRGSTGATPNPHTYKGEYNSYYKDPLAGPGDSIYSLHHRQYEATTGRFKSQDPIADDLNLYRYVSNNPVNAVDPSGLEEDDYPPIAPTTSPVIDFKQAQAEAQKHPGRFQTATGGWVTYDEYMASLNPYETQPEARLRVLAGISSGKLHGAEAAAHKIQQLLNTGYANAMKLEKSQFDELHAASGGTFERGELGGSHQYIAKSDRGWHAFVYHRRFEDELRVGGDGPEVKTYYNEIPGYYDVKQYGAKDFSPKAALEVEEIQQEVQSTQSTATASEFAIHLLPGATAADYLAYGTGGETTEGKIWVAIATVGDAAMVFGALANATSKAFQGTRTAKVAVEVAGYSSKIGFVANATGAGFDIYLLAADENNKGAHAGDLLLKLAMMGLDIKQRKEMQSAIKELADSQGATKAVDAASEAIPDSNPVDALGPGGHNPPSGAAVAPKTFPFEEKGISYSSTVEKGIDGEAVIEHFITQNGKKQSIGVSTISKQGVLSNALDVPEELQRLGISERAYAESAGQGFNSLETSYNAGLKSVNFREFFKVYDPAKNNAVEALLQTPAGKVASRNYGLKPDPASIQITKTNVTANWIKE